MELIALSGEARVADIAQRMGVAQPTVTRTINRLKREGLVMSKPYRGVDFLVAVGVPETSPKSTVRGLSTMFRPVP